MEDPDLTLVSLNATVTSSVVPDDVKDENQRQWVSQELGSDSLISFLHHEEMMALESPARKGTDQSGPLETSSLAVDQVAPPTGREDVH